MNLKVKLFAWWIDTPRLTERFKRQFIGSYFTDSRVELVWDDSYDYAVVFGYTKEHIKTDKDHTIFFFQEPHWSNNWDREAYKKSNRVFCPSKELYGNYEEYIEHPAYMFYGGHGDELFEIDNILNYKNTSNKPKQTSFIVTYRSSSPLTGGHEHNIYRERVMLADYLLTSNSNVDVYGQQWEYYTNNDHPNLKKSIYTKFLGLDSYKFSIAIENSQEKNYITEKLYDVLFFNTIPIYAGAPNVRDVPLIKDILIEIPNIYNAEESAEYIKNVATDDLYFQKSAIINDIKYQIFNSAEYNIWKKIINEII